MSAVTRSIEFRPAWDRRDPSSSRNYGVHGLDMKFVLKGPEGAVQFLIFTNWMLPHVRAEHHARHTDHVLCDPMGADLGYHRRSPQFAGQEPSDDCPYLEGAPCYYDGSGLQAAELLDRFIAEGEAAVWSTLDDRYRDWVLPETEVEG